MDCILCMDQRGGIGKDNALPWHIPNDLARFKTLTLNRTVLMGSNTFFSLPPRNRPLPGPNRYSVVVTKNPDDEKFDEHRGHPRLTITRVQDLVPIDECILIGGAQLFKYFQSQIRILHLTVVHSVYECDTFVYIDFSEWKIIRREDYSDHTYYILQRDHVSTRLTTES